MNKVYEELTERIRGEIPDLDRLLQRALQAWTHSHTSTKEQGLYLDSVALNLHGFYSGLERLFELIARHIDQSNPSGEMWHRDLLHQMAQEVANIRPAVIDPNRIPSLDELRRFRHLVRNIYTFNLVPEKIMPLILGLSELWSQVQEELMAFAEFLSDLAQVKHK